MTTLGSLTSAEVDERPPFTLVIPLGATEQHGPHLPLDTDTRVAEAVAERVVAAIDETLLGPTIAIGASGEHEGFAGTLSVGTEVLSSMLLEIVRTAGPEVTRVAVINAHGGNAAAIALARQICNDESRELVAWSVRLAGADAHAGRTETSIMLALAPELVHLDLAQPGVLSPMSDILDTLIEDGLIGVTQSGVLGDPTGANADEGWELLNQLTVDAIKTLGG